MTSQNIKMCKFPVCDLVPGQLTSRAMVSVLFALVTIIASCHSYLLGNRDLRLEHPPHLGPKEMFLLQGLEMYELLYLYDHYCKEKGAAEIPSGRGSMLFYVWIEYTTSLIVNTDQRSTWKAILTVLIISICQTMRTLWGI